MRFNQVQKINKGFNESFRYLNYSIEKLVTIFLHINNGEINSSKRRDFKYEMGQKEGSAIGRRLDKEIFITKGRRKRKKKERKKRGKKAFRVLRGWREARWQVWVIGGDRWTPEKKLGGGGGRDVAAGGGAEGSVRHEGATRRTVDVRGDRLGAAGHSTLATHLSPLQFLSTPISLMSESAISVCEFLSNSRQIFPSLYIFKDARYSIDN